MATQEDVECMKPTYEKALNKGHINSIQFEYLKSLGFDMSKIKSQKIDKAKDKSLNDASNELICRKRYRYEYSLK